MSTQRVARIFRQSGWVFGLALAFLIGSLFASRGGLLPRAMLEPVAAATLLETTAGTTLLSYQGRISNPTTNVALPDGTFGINFSLFSAASGGTQLWTESRSALQERGLITVLLGEVTPLPLPIFDGRDLWLQLQVNGETLSPRQRLAWVAYAINARKAETVIDNAITSAKLADGQVTSADIGDGQIASADIADGQITSADLGDGQVTAADIADGQIASAEIADGQVTSAEIADGQVAAVDLADGTGSGVDADLLDGQNSNAFAAANHTHPGLAPVAFGTILANATIASGTGNFSVVWNAGANQQWYEITITGEN